MGFLWVRVSVRVWVRVYFRAWVRVLVRMWFRACRNKVRESSDGP